MSTPNPTHIDVIAKHSLEFSEFYVEWRCRCEHPEARWSGAGISVRPLHAAHVVSKLTEAGYSIIDPDGLLRAFAAAAEGAAMADDRTPPPVTKYKLTVQVYGNSHDEIESELGYLLHGGYLLDSHYYERDEFTVFGGRRSSKLEHTNPEQTPEAYREQLREWSHRPRPAAEGEKP